MHDDQQTLSNDDSDRYTMLRVEVPDRPGLLTDLVQTLRVANVSVVAASIQTRGTTAVDVFKVTDSATGGKLSAEKLELLRRGVAHRARRQGISQSLGSGRLGVAQALAAAAAGSTTPPSPSDLLLIDQACRALPPFVPLMTSERYQARASSVSSSFSTPVPDRRHRFPSSSSDIFGDAARLRLTG